MNSTTFSTASSWLTVHEKKKENVNIHKTSLSSNYLQKSKVKGILNEIRNLGQ
jgi:hypothetical protein